MRPVLDSDKFINAILCSSPCCAHNPFRMKNPDTVTDCAGVFLWTLVELALAGANLIGTLLEIELQPSM